MKNPLTRAGMDKIYRDRRLDEIPWNIETPPKALVELVESGKVERCRAIDLGCGAGNYAIYLAGKGFDVTGVDISPAAVEIAQRQAREKEVGCSFLVADLLGDLAKAVAATFDFAYDWEVLHHIFPDQRTRYVKNVYSILNRSGKYLSVCFNEADPLFGGSGAYRKTSLGTVLYFSTLAELKDLFSPYFTMLDLKTIEIQGRSGGHIVNYAFMGKKEARARNRV